LPIVKEPSPLSAMSDGSATARSSSDETESAMVSRLARGVSRDLPSEKLWMSLQRCAR
jgi:hypothetical protein